MVEVWLPVSSFRAEYFVYNRLRDETQILAVNRIKESAADEQPLELTMRPEVKRAVEENEYWFEEGCHILEVANDEGDDHLSIARARVEVGMATEMHMLRGITERYIILSGYGRVEVAERLCCDVAPGDIVRIPSGASQRITNTGETDLVFYAVCSPPFRRECYISLKK